MKRRYNWIPDLPDFRDYLYSDLGIKPKQKKIPPSVDLRKNCSPVVNQGKIGSCTGNALSGALEYLERAGDPSEVLGEKFERFSRLFIYYNERLLEGHQDQDSGAMLRDGIKTLNAQGCCPETDWKYLATNVLKKPTSKAYQLAKPHHITSYLRIEDLQEMKMCLASEFPFVFGFTVYESFESPMVARTGKVPMPTTDEQVLGGHAVMAVGYDDREQCLIVRNSWGDEWGDQGYFWLPYDYVTNPGLAQDFWTLRK